MAADRFYRRPPPKVRARANFGLVKDAFVSHGEDDTVRVNGYTTKPDLSIYFEISLKKADELGKALVKYVKERRESRERIRQSLMKPKEMA